VYADARREGIARPAAGRLDSRKSSGMYKAIGSRGRASKRCVYVEVVRVSCVERLVRRSAWSGGLSLRGGCEGGKVVPCASMPASTASSSSDSEGYWKVRRRRVAAACADILCVVCVVDTEL
jgi:hypothetical protein